MQFLLGSTLPVLFGIVSLAPALAAQSNSPASDIIIDAQTRGAVIDGVLSQLTDSYVFSETAEAMEQEIRARASRGDYDRITSAQTFADSLTSHLRAISGDKHLRVRFSAEPLPQRGPRREPTPEMRARREGRLRSLNFGFEKVERLAGNVGYLELRGFMDAELGEQTVAAAMSFLAHTDVLIVDLRRNGGGSPHMVALLSSYLFGPEPVHLNSLYWRPQDRTDHFHTRPEVSGTRYGPEKPVYVLTSERTFSAAEEFTYNLQSLERATVVGETTGGGAHPGGVQRLHEHFSAFIPTGRAINPITQTNWEGTGVQPDVQVDEEEALATAHRAALQALLATATDPEHRAALEEAIRQIPK